MLPTCMVESKPAKLEVRCTTILPLTNLSIDQDLLDPNTCRSLGEDYGASVTHQKQERRKINFSLRNLNVNVSNFSLSISIYFYEKDHFCLFLFFSHSKPNDNYIILTIYFFLDVELGIRTRTAGWWALTIPLSQRTLAYFVQMYS